jgi:hypothetical protein
MKKHNRNKTVAGIINTSHDDKRILFTEESEEKKQNISKWLQ